MNVFTRKLKILYSCFATHEVSQPVFLSTRAVSGTNAENINMTYIIYRNISKVYSLFTRTYSSCRQNCSTLWKWSINFDNLSMLSHISAHGYHMHTLLKSWWIFHVVLVDLALFPLLTLTNYRGIFHVNRTMYNFSTEDDTQKKLKN